VSATPEKAEEEAPESTSVELLQTGEIFVLWGNNCGHALKLKEEEVFCRIPESYLIRQTNQLNKRRSGVRTPSRCNSLAERHYELAIARRNNNETQQQRWIRGYAQIT
jgi:hypothetical protein